MKIRRIKEIERKKQAWFIRFLVQNLHQNTDFYLQELKQVLSDPEWSADEKDVLKIELFYRYVFYNGNKYLTYSPAEKTLLLSTINDSIAEYNINLINSLKDLMRITDLEVLPELLNLKSVKLVLDSYPQKDDIFLGLLENGDIYTAVNIGDVEKVFSIFKSILGVEPENYRSATGQTILHLAYRSYYKYMFLNISEKYRSLVNVLDLSGNSPLYYAVNEQDNYYDYDDTCNAKNYELFAQLMESGAKYVRNFVEAKNILHLKVAMHQPLELDKLAMLNVDIDAIDLESGRTALTHAVVLKNDEAAIELIKNGASPIKSDKYNRTPLDYALAYGDLNLVTTMMQHLPVDFLASKHERSFIALACFSGNKELYAWLKANIRHKNEIDNAIITMVDQERSIMPSYGVNLEYLQQLIIYAAVAKMLPALRTHIAKQVRINVLDRLVANPAILPSGSAYGVELELSDVPCVPELPLDLLLEWFEVDFKHDGSVVSSIFSAHNLCVFNEEIVSGVLDSTAKLKQFLLFSEYMYNSGATVGRSTGMHVHVNIQGNSNAKLPSITNSMRLGSMRATDVELAVVKQIIINWVEIEPLLQSFLRNGELQNIHWLEQHYAAPIKPLLDAFMECQTLDEIIETSPSRYHALNVKSLRNSNGGNLNYQTHGHGTIEVRIHGGASHKQIIGSWLNFVDRLVRISVDQVQEKINNKEEFAFAPFSNIKDLVHVLLAERNYTLTWDSKLKSAVDSTAPVTISDWPVHERIQSAEVYKCFQKSKAKQMALDCAAEVPISVNPHEVGNITNWLRLTDQYPGIVAGDSNSKYNSHDNPAILRISSAEALHPSIISLLFMFACLLIGIKKMPKTKPSCPLLFNYNSRRSELPLLQSDTQASYGTIENSAARTSYRQRA